MISTGLWDRVNGVGSSELVGGTTVHELAHNHNIWHGGPPPVWNAATRVRHFEPNCKPNYPSVASYLFQVDGLRCTVLEVVKRPCRLIAV